MGKGGISIPLKISIRKITVSPSYYLRAEAWQSILSVLPCLAE
jgi:hypothetical protein